MTSIVVCVGTRPDFIKMAPVILKLEEKGVDYRILHTGQHYSPDLADVYKELPLRDPDVHFKGLENCKTHAEKTAFIMTEAERYFMKERPEIVLVQGDTDHSLACGIASRKLGIHLGHVESGLRCRDWRVPEEHNRRMLDHISEILFAPTLQSVVNLSSENVPGDIILTGNTVMDSLRMVLDRVHAQPLPFEYPYMLLTAHREENVDHLESLKRIIKVTERIHRGFNMPILFPAHPRTVDRLKRVKLGFRNYVKVVPPMPYIKFLSALLHSSLVLTDSGGVQEEACALQVPCVVLRESTERVESVTVGASLVTGLNSKLVYKAAREMISRPREWANPYDPYNDCNAADRIVVNLMSRL